MIRHFATFLSPGTLMAEATTREIDSWDVASAADMAHKITERHGATPYAFYFTTMERDDADFEPRETARSVTHFLGGTIWTVEDVAARNDPKERILLANMRGNGYHRVICNDNSWRTVVPIMDEDVVLDWQPRRTVEVGG